jgi:hypothetical protein
MHIAGVTCDNCRHLTSQPQNVTYTPTDTITVPGRSDLSEELWAIIEKAKATSATS